MPHAVNALIGSRDALKTVIEFFGEPSPLQLTSELVIVGLDETRLSALGGSGQSCDGFAYLNDDKARRLASLVGNGPGLYIETNYHGGDGGQGAVLFEKDACRWKRSETTEQTIALQASNNDAASGADTPAWISPISEGLRKLGVVRKDAHDEFDQVGLDQIRCMEDFGLVGDWF